MRNIATVRAFEICNLSYSFEINPNAYLEKNDANNLESVLLPCECRCVIRCTKGYLDQINVNAE